MPFAVHIMRPERSSAAVFSATTPLTPLSSAPSNNAIEVLAAAIKPEQTFGELIAATEKRFRQAYGDQAIEGMRFGTKMKGPLGEDYLSDDIIGDMFDSDARKDTLQLSVYLEQVEGNSKKRSLDEESATEEGSMAKRRRVESDSQPPPSAQPQSLPRTSDFTGSQSIFSTLKVTPQLRSDDTQSKQRKSRPASHNPNWKPEEDEVVLKGMRLGWTDKKIAQQLSEGIRSASAVRGRRAVLKRGRAKLPAVSKPKDVRTAFVALSQEPLQDNATTVQPDSSPGAGKPSPAAVTPANVTITPPRPRPSDSNGRTDRERWKEAYEGTHGDSQKARDNYKAILNRENMLEAVMQEDKDEIARLKSQRRRLERERSDSNGAQAPRRHDPLAGLQELPIKAEAADEDVIREDDYSTADEDKPHSIFDDSDDLVEDEEMEESDIEDEVDIVDGPGKILDEDVEESIEEIVEEPAVQGAPVKIEERRPSLGLPEPMVITPPRIRPKEETASETRARLQKVACPFGSDDESSSDDSD